MVKSESRRKAEKTAHLVEMLLRTLSKHNASRDEGALALSSIFALTVGSMERSRREKHMAELAKMVEDAKEMEGYTGVHHA